VLERNHDYKGAYELWADIEKKSLRAFEKEQASYNAHRLQLIVLEGRK